MSNEEACLILPSTDQYRMTSASPNTSNNGSMSFSVAARRCSLCVEISTLPFSRCEIDADIVKMLDEPMFSTFGIHFLNTI